MGQQPTSSRNSTEHFHASNVSDFFGKFTQSQASLFPAPSVEFSAFDTTRSPVSPLSPDLGVISTTNPGQPHQHHDQRQPDRQQYVDGRGRPSSAVDVSHEGSQDASRFRRHRPYTAQPQAGPPQQSQQSQQQYSQVDFPANPSISYDTRMAQLNHGSQKQPVGMPSVSTRGASNKHESISPGSGPIVGAFESENRLVYCTFVVLHWLLCCNYGLICFVVVLLLSIVNQFYVCLQRSPN